MFVSTFIPGAILSFSIFRKDDFNFLEKLFIGFALGMIILPLIPFLLYLLAGIKYGYSIALFSVGILYAIALAFFVKNKVYQGMALPSLNFKEIKIPKSVLLSLVLLLIILASYTVRIGSYSPIFQELDPYYYTYTAQQLLTFGENPQDDQTAWFPEVSVNHRLIPEISYLEAIWYSLYTGGSDYSNMLLALIASMYPPIAAALAVFFIYLFVSITSKRGWGIMAAGLVSFAPIFILKLAAGEHEVQPYAFFALTFFYAMYALSIKKKDHRFSALAGLGYAAVALGSFSQLLALVSAMIFMILQSIAYFIRDEDEGNIRYLLVSNSIVFIIGPLFGSAILKDIFGMGQPSLAIVIPFLISLVFVGLLYLLKQKVPDRQRSAMALAAVLLLGLLIYGATPAGDYVKNIGKAGFEIAKYRAPLDRTIAEQRPAGDSFGGEMGFMAESYYSVASYLLWPLASLLGPSSFSYVGDFFGSLFYLIGLPFQIIVDSTLALFVGLTNIFLDSDVVFSEKTNSLLHLWLFVFWLGLIYSGTKFAKKGEDNTFLFVLAVVMPPLVVGLIKAKYTIYSGVLLAVAIGFSLGCIESFNSEFFKSEELRKRIRKALIIIAVLLVLLQFVHRGFAPSLLWGSFQPLYQNDPALLAPKFDKFCNESGDWEVCAAAADPLGYANASTNSQYSGKLCALSVLSNYSYYTYLFDGNTGNDGLVPPHEASVLTFRCQRISSYWVDSMEWIRENTEDGARVISWWDYGHWINFFGQRNAVLRNEHKSHTMIGAVADAYLNATPEELKAYMKAHGSEYALFDIELIHSGTTLGGKYFPLNYLSCAWNNETDVSYGQTESQCEAEHLWETIFVTSNPCIISTLTNKTGFTAYRIYEDVYKSGEDGRPVFVGTFYRPYYPSYCMSPSDEGTMAHCQNSVRAEPAYCVGEVMLATGEEIYGTYYLNETYPNGDLKLNKGLLNLPYSLPTTLHLGPVSSFTMFYTKDPIWLEGGEIKSGYEDRKGKFYDSNLYHALFMDELPGFKLVYETPGRDVRIYKIDE